MSEMQKTIKYIAMGFAVFLAVTIISAILGAFISGAQALGGINIGLDSGKRWDYIEVYTEDIRKIALDGSLYEVHVKTGEELSVELTNVRESYQASVSGKTLKLSEKSTNFFGGWFGKQKKEAGSVTLYLPEDLTLDEFKLDCGMGEVNVEQIQTDYMDIDGGMGNMTADRIIAQKANLDGGMGNIEIDQVEFGQTDIDGGMGNIIIDGKINGDIDVDSGMGSIEMGLIGDKSDYNIKVSSGLGSVSINGENYSDVKWNNPQAPYRLEIDGGMGDVDLDFSNSVE